MDIRHFFFKYRSYTPIPLIIVALVFARPTWTSFFSGLGIMLIGEWIRFRGVAYAGSATRTTEGAGGDRLVTSGPFAHVRNPLYLGNFFLSSGVLIMSWVWMPFMALFFILLFALQYSLIVNLEEEYLAKRFGSEYEAYCSSVRRWIPRVTPYKGKEILSPNIKKALRSERNTFQSIAAVCILILVRWHLL